MGKVSLVRSEEIRALVKQHYPHSVDIPYPKLMAGTLNIQNWLITNHGPNAMERDQNQPRGPLDVYIVDTEGKWLLRLGRFYFQDQNTAFEFKMLFG